MVICLGRGADLHTAQLMPLPLTISCSSKSSLPVVLRFYLLVLAYRGSPGQNPESCKTVVVVPVLVVDNEWKWHQLGHMQICTSPQTDNHTSRLPLSLLQARCPSCCPTNSITALRHCILQNLIQKLS